MFSMGMAYKQTNYSMNVLEFSRFFGFKNALAYFKAIKEFNI